MTQTFTGRRRVRRFFGSIREVAEMPNLIEVQKASYDQFLLVEEPEGGRPDEGLQAVFKSVFPISDFSNTALLEFVRYDFDPPKYDVDECRQRGMTYSAPLKVTLRLIVFDIDPDTNAKSVKDIKEQEVYMGEMPLDDQQRHLHRQRHRARHRLADAPLARASSSTTTRASRIRAASSCSRRASFPIAAPGSTSSSTPRTSSTRASTAGGRFRSRRSSSPSASTARRSSTPSTRPSPTSRSDDGWRVPFDANRLRGFKANTDMIDADSGEVVLEAGQKLTARAARQLVEKGLKALKVADDDLYGHYLAEEMVNPETGEIYAEAGDEINEKVLKVLLDAGYDELKVLDIDHVNTGAYIRNTLAVDKNETREDALFDIYRVMRPGEPPTVETAEAMFQSLFFDPERYDLSAVGRVKMNMRLDLDAEDTVRVLRKEDIIAVIATLVALRDGKGEIDDIDNLGNRRVRSVGELMENQYRIGLLRMERAIKERMSSVEIGNVMPQDLINAKPAAAAVREFFGSSQLSQFMDQTNPLSEITHKRRLSALGPGGLTRERAGFEVRDVHPTHYGRICPIETPEGPNIGLINSLATFARVNKYGFIESPYRRVKDGQVTEEVVYLSAMEESKYTVAQANALLDAEGQVHRGPDPLPPRRRRDHGPVRPRRLHGRVAEAGHLGRRGADPVPRERRRQPRADGLQHAAPGGAAGEVRGAAGRHRHGGDRRPRLRARRFRRAAPASSTRSTRPVSSSARPEDLDPSQVGRRHLPADEVPALEPEHLHQPASAGAGGRPRRQGRHHRRRSVDRPRRSRARPERARRVHAVERLQLRGTRSSSPSASCAMTSSPRSTSRSSRSWPATPSSGRRKSPATSRTCRKRR